MNIAEASIRYKTITLVMTAMIILGGASAYQNLGRLEDPEFTVKDAQVFTRYPGATAMEVAEEVTDEIETAIQQMGQVAHVTSISEAGLSTVKVEIKTNYDKTTLPQVWDELRRKVGDAQSKLPPGTSVSIVNDDFGDVYGIFYALYGDGYTYAELKTHVDLLRRELLLVTDVGKVAIFSDLPEVIYVEISRSKLAQLGLSPQALYNSLAGQNLVSPAGRMKVGSLHLRIQPTGEFTSVEDIGNLLILQDDASQTKLYLKDVATIERGYTDPPKRLMHFNGRPAIGIGISTVAGGNVVTMGNAVDVRLKELATQTPIGMELSIISHQAQAVTTSISGFVISLIEAIAIVVGILMFAMGLRSGVLIGFVLLLTVMATFIVMDMKDVMLERISLGALIIALGMLVDNAIVVVEGILVNLQRGMGRIEAAAKIVGQTIWPLFGATVIAVLTFAAIGVSQDATGEYCRSLFQVILFSLMLSWVLAITITPLLGFMFIKVDDAPDTERADPYGGLLFTLYKNFLVLCLKLRWGTLVLLVGMLYLAVIGFGMVEQSFFPQSTRPQFMVHYWLPQGTHIRETETDLKSIADHLIEDEQVTDVTSFIGGGSLRFLLTYAPEEANSSYGMLLVGVKDFKQIDELRKSLQDHLNSTYPNAQSFSRKFVLGPGDPAKIHVRLSGPDADVLRVLASETRQVLLTDPTTTDITNDWRQRVPLIRPIINETAARNAGITRAEITRALQTKSEGTQVGQYREQDNLLPIIARSPENERKDVKSLHDLQIWSPVAKGTIPISQLVSEFQTSSENAIVRRRDRMPTMTVKCDPSVGQASDLFTRLRPKVEKRFAELVKQKGWVGYNLAWGGEYEDSGEAQAALKGNLPPIGILIGLTLVVLFNSIRLPIVIFLTVPLALIGVTIGLLVCNQPFGFMALLGFMSLAGMLIKNAIVLIDEINMQISEGKDKFQAIVDSGVGRMRPVGLAALTTVLGMIPLLADAFFKSMAVTIMFGLTFATILTLIVVPVLYACFFKIPSSSIVAGNQTNLETTSD